MSQKVILFLILNSFNFVVFSQVESNTKLYKTILTKDSLLFNLGFNQCDSTQLEHIISQDFEFYHDKHGITNSKADFVYSIKEGLCKMDYKATRQLQKGSTEIFPLKKNGNLYGAIQNGTHLFYALESDSVKYVSSIAKFTHLWILEDDIWKLKRSLSFDHHATEKPINEDLLFKDRKETERWLKQKQVPAVGIGFIENGVITKTSVYGELENGIPAPKETIWNVASLTKPITALVALKLVDAGQLKLNEPLYKYYIDPDLKNDSRVKKLTTRLILSHQTGFPNWRNGKLSFDFTPGTQYQYSGEGYEYLRKCLEFKFKKSLNELAKTLIFDPLQMNNTRFYWDKNVDSTKFAKWHTSQGELYTTHKNKTQNAADDLLTTIEDYTKFINYITIGAGLSNKTYKQMVGKQVKVNQYKNFGLGWWIDNNVYQKENAIVHGGDDIGVHTIAFILPKSKKGLIIFTNSDNGTSIFEPILLKYLGQKGQGILNIEMGKKPY
jgi:CubicO group peptidase (beta-lactamase class C family)